MTDIVTCSKCGSVRPSDLALASDRPPCETCGATSLVIGASMCERIEASVSAAGELIPGGQTRDWRRRWDLIQDQLQLVLRPETVIMSSEAIHQSLQRLTSFFILCFHLKDALIDAAPKLGLKREDVEGAINGDSRLALVADLANLDKHMILTRRTKSGIAPEYDGISGLDQTTGGWRLSARIKHGPLLLDGLSVAQDAVDAWREWLNGRGLV